MHTIPESLLSSKPDSSAKTYHTLQNCSVRFSRKQNTLVSFQLDVEDLALSDIRIAHEYHEEVESIIKLQQKKLLGDVSELAINSAHGLAFHRGLGTPLFPSSSTLSKYLNEGSIREFASDAYAKSNIAVVANGTSQADLSKVVSEFFTQVPAASASPISGEASKYYGGEERIAHGSGNSMVIAFPGSSSFTAGGSYKPEIAVLAALLGGKSSIKWSPGFSLLAKAASSFPGASALTSHFAYSDAGLLAIQFNGSAQAIRGATTEAIKSLKSISEGSISKEDFTKAVALAKYTALEEGQSLDAGLVATGAGLVHGGKPFQIDEIGKSVEAVTAEKLKSVSLFTAKHVAFTLANVCIGCQGFVGGQGDCLGGRRLVCIAICGGDWSQGIDVWEGRAMKRVVSTAAPLECIVDKTKFFMFRIFVTYYPVHLLLVRPFVARSCSIQPQPRRL